jgi:uncharacterized protein YjiS (DUF1127 family)
MKPIRFLRAITRTDHATRVLAPAARLGQLLREWQHRARSRAELASLDRRQMRDAGLGDELVAREISKFFWHA